MWVYAGVVSVVSKSDKVKDMQSQRKGHTHTTVYFEIILYALPRI